MLRNKQEHDAETETYEAVNLKCPLSGERMKRPVRLALPKQQQLLAGPDDEQELGPELIYDQQVRCRRLSSRLRARVLMLRNMIERRRAIPGEGLRRCSLSYNTRDHSGTSSLQRRPGKLRALGAPIRRNVAPRRRPRVQIWKCTAPAVIITDEKEQSADMKYAEDDLDDMKNPENRAHSVQSWPNLVRMTKTCHVLRVVPTLSLNR